MENQTTTTNTSEVFGTTEQFAELTVTSAADILAAELAPTVAQLETIQKNYADVTTLDFTVSKNRTKLADADKELKKLKTAVNQNIKTFKDFTKNLTAELVTRCDDLIKSIEAIRAPIEAKRTEIEAAEKAAAAERKRIEAAERAALEKFTQRTEQLFDVGGTFNGKIYNLNGVLFTPEAIRDMTDGEFNLLFDVANIDAPSVEPDDEVPPAAGCVEIEDTIGLPHVENTLNLKPYQIDAMIDKGQIKLTDDQINQLKLRKPRTTDFIEFIDGISDVPSPGQFPAIESPGFEDCRQQVIQAIKAKNYKTMPELISIIEGLHPTTVCE